MGVTTTATRNYQVLFKLLFTKTTMATTQQVEKRNIVVVGKTGAGKSTVANNIFVSDKKFEVGKSTGSQTSEVLSIQVKHTDQTTKIQYDIKIIDTMGIFDTRITNYKVIEKIKKYFQENVSEGVSLVLFVFRKGRFTEEEKKALEFLMKNFHSEISDISALVITNCEVDNETARRTFIEDFKKNVGPIASFMSKGIYTVGFPDTTDMKPRLRAIMEEDMEDDIKQLRELAMRASQMRLGKEMFEKSFWEKIKAHCIIL